MHGRAQFQHTNFTHDFHGVRHQVPNAQPYYCLSRSANSTMALR
jgi:hypothetical protein